MLAYLNTLFIIQTIFAASNGICGIIKTFQQPIRFRSGAQSLKVQETDLSIHRHRAERFHCPLLYFVDECRSHFVLLVTYSRNTDDKVIARPFDHVETLDDNFGQRFFHAFS